MENMDKQTGMPHLRTPMISKIEVLQEKGFTEEFQITPEGLKALGNGKIYGPKDLCILEHFRFEGITNPDDMAILYVMETNDGVKGTIIDAYGLYSDNELEDFLKEVEDKNNDNI